MSQGHVSSDSLESVLNPVQPEAPSAFGRDSLKLPPPSLLSALRRHWRLNLLLISIFALTGYLFVGLKGRAANAQASILVQDPSNPSGTDDRYVKNQAKILALPSVAEKTAKGVSTGAHR